MTEDEQFAAISAYVDRLVAIARPRRLVYLAIDGVAPRAKMNQQRSRRSDRHPPGNGAPPRRGRTALSAARRALLLHRYRVPRELAQAAAREEALSAARGRAFEEVKPAAHEAGPPFDSNCITPGTEFLYSLGDRFREWIKHKMATDPHWMNGPQVRASSRALHWPHHHTTAPAAATGTRRLRASAAFRSSSRVPTCRARASTRSWTTSATAGRRTGARRTPAAAPHRPATACHVPLRPALSSLHCPAHLRTGTRRTRGTACTASTPT
jgi:hypothetical protein